VKPCHLALCAILQGCSVLPRSENTSGSAAIDTFMASTTSADNCGGLEVLSWIGGLSIIGGIAALVITRGSMGIRAVLIGVGLVLLNYAVARYAHALFVPILVGSGLVSLTYAFIVVRNALRSKSNAQKSWAPSPPISRSST